MREINEDLSKWTDVYKAKKTKYCEGVISPTLIYRFKAIQITISVGFVDFLEFWGRNWQANSEICM